MTRVAVRRRLLLLCGAAGLLVAFGLTSASAQNARRVVVVSGPRLEAVAETKLLMEGLNQANFRGLERLLKQQPADEEAWKFARGQGLLIAETGNLLLLRPPHNNGERVWMDRAVELRESAAKLARAAGSHDYTRSRAALGDLANSCNRCHQTFRVAARIVPFAEGAGE
jgi:hypothetical protein